MIFTRRSTRVAGSSSRGSEPDILDANKKVVPGIQGGELAMVSHVTQGEDSTDSGRHAPIRRCYLVSSLEYRYKRATVKIYGNVTKASHGETVSEVLGSGDATSARQRFELKRPPLTVHHRACHSRCGEQ